MSEKKSKPNAFHWPGDLYGGISAAVVALPLAPAYGELSGMGAMAGLYGAIALGLIAACFGSRPALVSGPTGPMTVVSAVVIATEIESFGNLEAALGTIIAIFLLAGMLQIILGVLKIGQYVRFMPYPVISGFMSGIGVMVIILQIFPFLGYVSPARVPDVIGGLPEILGEINFAAVALAGATIAIIYLVPRVSRHIPGPLVALLTLSVVSAVMQPDVAFIGNINQVLPRLQLDTLGSVDWPDIPAILLPALTLAALGSINTLLTSAVADNMSKSQHDNNKELIGQGLGNIGAAMIGGIPGAAAEGRTVLNIANGAKTRFSSLLNVFFLLLALLTAGAYAKYIPLPVFAGILITVGIGIIDFKAIKHIAHVPRTDAVIMVVVLGMTVFVDLLQAIAVGMVLASLLFMKKMSDIAEDKSVMGFVEDFTSEESWDDESELADELRNKIFIKHFDGPIFFGFAAKFKAMVRALPEVDVVIMRMSRVPYMDQTGIYAIEDALMALRKKNILVLITGLQDQPKDMLKRIGLVPDMIAEENLYVDFSTCVRALESGAILKSNNKHD